jgi:hypothetical protein
VVKLWCNGTHSTPTPTPISPDNPAPGKKSLQLMKIKKVELQKNKICINKTHFVLS